MVYVRTLEILLHSISLAMLTLVRQSHAIRHDALNIRVIKCHGDTYGPTFAIYTYFISGCFISNVLLHSAFSISKVSNQTTTSEICKQRLGLKLSPVYKQHVYRRVAHENSTRVEYHL